MKRRLAVILAADVVGYSRFMGEDAQGTAEKPASEGTTATGGASDDEAGTTVPFLVTVMTILFD